MSQTEEFVKVVEAAKEAKGVIFVTGKPGSGKSKVLREAAEDKKWDYVSAPSTLPAASCAHSEALYAVSVPRAADQGRRTVCSWDGHLC